MGRAVNEPIQQNWVLIGSAKRASSLQHSPLPSHSASYPMSSELRNSSLQVNWGTMRLLCSTSLNWLGWLGCLFLKRCELPCFLFSGLLGRIPHCSINTLIESNPFVSHLFQSAWSQVLPSCGFFFRLDFQQNISMEHWVHQPRMCS